MYVNVYTLKCLFLLSHAHFTNLPYTLYTDLLEHTGGKAKSNNHEISSTIATIKILKTDSESPSSVEKLRIGCFLIEGNFVHNIFALYI